MRTTSGERSRSPIIAVLISTAALSGVGGRITATMADNTRAIDQATSQSPLPIAVDGSKEPQRIPDRLAYVHFVLANAEREIAEASELARRRLVLQDLMLAEADEAALILALRGVRDELDSVEAAMRSLSATSATTVGALRSRRERALDDAISRFRTYLSPKGLESLERYLRDHVKRHIVIYGDK